MLTMKKEREEMRKKLSVITGGSSGLGLAAARCLASETSVLLCARGAAGLEKAKAELLTFGADVHIFQMDAAEAEAAKACAEYAAGLGDVVNVIHTAGVSPANTKAEDILRINTLGPINIVQAFYPVMAEDGVAICFGSTAGYVMDTNEKMAPLAPLAKQVYEKWEEPGFPALLMDFLANVMHLPENARAGSAYCLSKNFVKYFVYANTWRFAKKGCRILSVSPGSYLTPMHQALIDNAPESAGRNLQGIPLQRWGHPYEMGKLVAFLCSKGAGYITGVDILADGGCTFAGTVTQIGE